MPQNRQDFSSLSLEQYHRSLSIVCYALVAGLIIFTGYFHFFLMKEMRPDSDLASTLIIAGLIFFVAGLSIAYLLIPKRMQSLKELTGKADKLKGHYQNTIIRFAAIEGPSLFSLIGYFLTAQGLFLVGVGVGILLLMVTKPTREKILIETGMSESDF